MFSWLFGKYYYEVEIFEMIETIDKRRKEKRIKGMVMSSSFADDLKDLVKGLEVIEENKKIIKSSSDSMILYDDKHDYKHKTENIKMTIEKQFKKDF
tara:strand:- start:1064 stop:1354 length:291 start_codon:yes stop_codon:yes gene_type:complete